MLLAIQPFPVMPGPDRASLPPDPCRLPGPPPSKSASNDGTLLFECTPSVMPSSYDDVSCERKPLSSKYLLLKGLWWGTN